MVQQFLLNLDALLPGDVVLSNEPTVLSRTIAVATSGKYSHAMLYVGNSIIHAELGGVYSKNPQRLLFATPDQVLVMRCAELANMETRKAVVHEARALVGSLHTVWEAALAKFKSRSESNARSTAQYCSRLLAHAYLAARIQLVPNADFCSPNDLHRSLQLHEIAGGVRPASPADLAFAATDDPNLKLQRDTFTWLKKLREIAKRAKYEKPIQTISDAIEFVMLHPKHDRVASQALHEGVFLTHFDIDRVANPHRYDVGKLLDWIESSGIPAREILDSELEINRLEFIRISESLQACEHNLSQRPTSFVRLLHDLHVNRMMEIHCWGSVLREVRRSLKLAID